MIPNFLTFAFFVGNGPSGITLSYMLAGHWPYWIPEKIHAHPDELLRARLTYADSTKSLVEQDLVTLADGLEGRSTNPVSLLVSKVRNHPHSHKSPVPPFHYDVIKYLFLICMHSWTVYRIRALI